MPSITTLNKRLAVALGKRDKALAKILCEQGADPNCDIGISEGQFLRSAVDGTDIELVELLLEIGAAPNKVERVQHYLDSDRTKEYINELGQYLKAVNPAFDENQIVILKKGSPVTGGGTWFHPKLAMDFSRWLSAKFAIWCDEQILNIIRPKQPQYGLKTLPPAPYYITEHEAAQFKKSIEAHCKGNGKAYPMLYRKVYEYYGITSYKHIPAGNLEEAARLCGMKLLELVKPRMPEARPEPFRLSFTPEELEDLVAERVKALEGEVLPKEQNPLLTGSAYRHEARLAFSAYLDQCSAILKQAGVNPPEQWPVVDGKTIDGLVASMMWNSQWVMSFDPDNMRPCLRPIPMDALLISKARHIDRLINEDGYIVAKPSELLSKLQS